MCLSSEFMVSLWISRVCPLLEYGSCVWNVKYLRDARRLESLKNVGQGRFMACQGWNMLIDAAAQACIPFMADCYGSSCDGLEKFPLRC